MCGLAYAGCLRVSPQGTDPSRGADTSHFRTCKPEGSTLSSSRGMPAARLFGRQPARPPRTHRLGTDAPSSPMEIFGKNNRAIPGGNSSSLWTPLFLSRLSELLGFCFVLSFVFSGTWKTVVIIFVSP